MAIDILAATQTTGREFHAPGRTALIQLSRHAGGTWTLQIQQPGSPTTWQDTDITFTASGVKAFHSQAEIPYRLTGGSAGAVARLLDSARAP